MGTRAARLDYVSKLNLCTRLNVVLAHQSLTRQLMFSKLRPTLFLWPGLKHLLLQHKPEKSAAATAKQSIERPEADQFRQAARVILGHNHNRNPH